MVRTFLSSLNLNYERLFVNIYMTITLILVFYQSLVLTSSSPVKGQSTTRHLHLQIMVYSQIWKEKKKCIPTKVAFFDDNMLFFMQNSIARYVRWIMWTATACCTAAAISLTQDRISPSWIPIKMYGQMGFPENRSSKTRFRSDFV